MVGYPPEHLFHALDRPAVIAAAYVAAYEHLAGILG